ncbi:MAG: putative DNA-binding domain-containing protein [Burkholderiales bacterium]|nr:putative DNA-binding domain-containing protein [Burkholderiales bacterium]MDE2289477.1 putative DNA-binding domain-containing protein [Burkholderiales bacterium]MDE2609290.1 putative DNA-binding domain-containing protein [Burkholderiales bacterium]
MRAASSLLEMQLSFLAALYDSGQSGPTDRLADSCLEPAARLRIYRHNSEQIHLEALRTTFPAVRALVGDAFFDQTAARYRGANPSRSGNLQAFGEHFAEFLAAQADQHRLPYLSDVAQLEWRRQNAALAGDAQALSLAALGSALANADGPMRVSFHPSMQWFASPHPVLTLWQYAMQPSPQRLTLSESGEHVVLWRSADEVAMASVDAATFACIDVLARGAILDTAHAAASAQDPDFDFAACITSLVREELVTAITPV